MENSNLSHCCCAAVRVRDILFGRWVMILMMTPTTMMFKVCSLVCCFIQLSNKHSTSIKVHT